MTTDVTVAAGQSALVTVAAGQWIRLSTGPEGAARLENVTAGPAGRVWATNIGGREVYGPFESAGTVRVSAISDAVVYNVVATGEGKNDDVNVRRVGVIRWADRPIDVAPGSFATFSDLNNAVFQWNGAVWQPVGACDVIVDFASVAGTTGVSEQVIKQWTLPAGLLTSARYFEFKVLFTKSGVTDSATVRLRLGSAGTTSDAQILQSGVLGAALRQAGIAHSRFMASATQARLVGAATTSGFQATTSASAFPDNVAVPDANANPLILSATVQMAGSTDTPSVSHLIATAY